MPALEENFHQHPIHRRLIQHGLLDDAPSGASTGSIAVLGTHAQNRGSRPAE
jgi:hypothetical protein